MKRSNGFGFTIIETVLFFGITGLMIIGIMVGVGSSISSQRFKDSVMSMQTFLQQQYANATVSINNHDNSYNCSSSGITNALGGVQRGQSDCVILGKLISSNGNSKLTVNSIIGSTPTNLISLINDIDIFKSGPGYNTFISDIDTESYELDWGVTYAKAGGGSLDFSILIVKSPLTNIIRTFIYDGNVTQSTIQSNLVNDVASNTSLKICLINPDYINLTGARRTAITIDANASMGNGVRTLGDSSGC